MRNSRRLAVAASAVIATGSLIAGTAGVAGAANADAYNASAKADALTIKLFGQTITTSASEARLTPAEAFAKVTDALLQENSAEVTATPSDQAPADTSIESCAGEELTQIPLVNRAEVTCGTAHAALGKDARAIGAEVVLEVSIANLLELLQLQEPAQGGVTQIFDGLDQLIQPITGGTPLAELVDPATATVEDVLNDVLTLESTVRIVVAPTLAEVTSAGGKITSHARAQGVRIELLPPTAEASTNGLFPDLAPNEPLITITVGSAEATKVVGDPEAGNTKAALVRIQLGAKALADALGLPGEVTDIAVEGGQSVCLLPDPLTTCVQVAAASVDAEGNAIADGASIQLLKGVNGGIDLATGRASTGGTFEAAEAAIPADVPRELPRTGGPATLPLVGGGLLALAAATRRLSLRRR